MKRDVNEYLEPAITKAGSQADFAAKHKLQQSLISRVLTGKREPTEPLLQALGVERIVRYRTIPKPSLPKPTSTEKE